MEFRVVESSHAVRFRDRMAEKMSSIGKFYRRCAGERMKVLLLRGIQCLNIKLFCSLNHRYQPDQIKKVCYIGLQHITCRTSSAVEWLSVSTSSRTIFGCSFLELFCANLSASGRRRWTTENMRPQESKLGRLDHSQILAS